jgi:CHAT domain-containing protein
MELTNEAATASAILRTLPAAYIFHFAGHAIATAERSGLLLADSDEGEGVPHGFWSASDLQPASLRHCALVVLSACSTGELESAGLNDPNNLVRKFLSAGAGAVVASRWAVDSRTTRKLMAYFYAELKRGSTPAIALRQASQNVRALDGLDHPRFWAAFNVFSATDVALGSLKTGLQGRS